MDTLATRQNLQIDICSSIERTTGLQRQFNTLSVTYKLPHEVLEEIFAIYAALCRAYVAPPNTIGFGRPKSAIRRDLSKYSWIRVTHVCHHWRETALHSRRLWARLFLTSAPCIEAMLPRSGNLPLYIECSEPLTTDRRMRALQALRKDMHRVKSLSLVITPYQVKELAGIMDTTPALENFSIVNIKSYNRFAFRSKLLLDVPRPSLKRLAFDKFAWKSVKPVLDTSAGLTELSLANLQTRLVPMEELLAVLRSMADTLEILKLDNTLPKIRISKEVESLPAPQETISLEKLRFLRLAGPGYSPSYFLTHLTLPPSAIISIKFSSRGQYKPENQKMLVPIVVRHLQKNGVINESRPISSISFDSPLSHASLTIRGWSDVNSFQEMPSPTQSPKFTITIPTRFLNSISLLRSLTSALQVHSIRALCFSGLHKKFHLDRLLAPFSQLRELCVQNEFLEGLPRLLRNCIDISKKDDKPYKTQFLPQLETIVLHNIPFSYPYPTEHFWVSDLFSTLDTYSNLGFPLKRLVIRRGVNMKDDTISAKRRNSVQELDWDEVVGFEGVDHDQEWESPGSEVYDSDTPDMYTTSMWPGWSHEDLQEYYESSNYYNTELGSNSASESEPASDFGEESDEETDGYVMAMWGW
ncbi:hypothetical protein C8Q75DRAFT_389330 [Abortiporus biennis]|nr:hypothetical protein C8Q75DRAFT_389330 [Abortiporus biennis]